MASNPKTDLMAIFAAHDLLSAADRQEAQQPQPIALQTFDSVPGWAIVCAADSDRNAPLIRSGEVVLAEPDRGWMPVDGGLFLIEYVSAPTSPYGFENGIGALSRPGRANTAGTLAASGRATLAERSMCRTDPMPIPRRWLRSW